MEKWFNRSADILGYILGGVAFVIILMAAVWLLIKTGQIFFESL